MVRRPYRTKCRFFSDSTEENTIHWYVVPWSNGTLPYPHRIIPADWFPDRVNTKDIGEHSWEERPFDGWGRIVPPNPANDHICGTKEDFSGGCLRDSSRPPLVRGPDGIPDCCRPIPKGLVLGGTGEVNLGVGKVKLYAATPYFTASPDYTTASIWNPYTQGWASVWQFPVGGSGFPGGRIGGLTPGATYTVTINVWDTLGTVDFTPIRISDGALLGTVSQGPGSLSYTQSITMPPEPCWLWVRSVDTGYPANGPFVMFVTP